MDHTKPWSEISRHVFKKIMPAVGKALEGNFRYNLSELRYVFQSLHHHRYEIWKIKQDPERFRNNKKRTGINERCQEVSIV